MPFSLRETISGPREPPSDRYFRDLRTKTLKTRGHTDTRSGLYIVRILAGSGKSKLRQKFEFLTVANTVPKYVDSPRFCVFSEFS